jgi:hypothetical protein
VSFFDQLSDEKSYEQDNATAHTASNSMDALDGVFVERVKVDCGVRDRTM